MPGFGHAATFVMARRSALIMSDAFSAIMMVGALVLARIVIAKFYSDPDFPQRKLPCFRQTRLSQNLDALYESVS
jgi:hypothetical protein